MVRGHAILLLAPLQTQYALARPPCELVAQNTRQIQSHSRSTTKGDCPSFLYCCGKTHNQKSLGEERVCLA